MARQKDQWGQHFLVDNGTVESLLEAAKLKKSDVAIEIGPGKGVITRVLAHHARRVICIEKDESFARDLEDLPKNVELTFGDAIAHFESLAKEADVSVSNMPFHLCEPILNRCVATERLKRMAWITPLDWARRMQSHPLLSSCFDVEIVDEVKKTAFSPQPKTACAIVSIAPKRTNDVAGFVMRELQLQHDKKLKNALCEALILYTMEILSESLTKRAAKARVDRLGLDAAVLEKKVFELPLQVLQEIKESLEKKDI